MTRRILLPLVCSFLLLAFSTGTAQSQSTEKIKALIVDGQNNHDWRKTTPVLKEILEKSERFTVDVATAPTKKEKEADAEKYKKDLAAFKPDFAKYDVVVGNYNSSETGDEWSEETRKAFENFIENGGGYVCYHAADNSFRKWDAYHKMIGVAGWYSNAETFGKYLYWEDGKAVTSDEKGRCGHHGPRWAFLIDVRDFEHPVTKGLPESFCHCEDELYDCLRGPAADVSLLASAFAPKDKGGRDKHEPMLMAIPYGKGRIFHTTLGHGVQMLKSVSFIVTFLRGTEWAATGNVTIPVPDDFPGKDKPVFRE